MRRYEKTFKLKNVGKDTMLIDCQDMGIVIENKRLMVTAYATNADYSEIYAAMPLSTSNKMRGLTYKVAFPKEDIATIWVADLRIYIDFKSKKVSNNKDLNVYGSDAWGKVIDWRWKSDFDKLFN